MYSARAHVFQIDPVTKKNWNKASSQAVPVSFYFDTTRKTHRIISVDGTKALINSSIIAGMAFQKTSAKFGQWTDMRAATVYGLGFGSPEELEKVGCVVFGKRNIPVRVLPQFIVLSCLSPHSTTATWLLCVVRKPV